MSDKPAMGLEALLQQLAVAASEGMGLEGPNAVPDNAYDGVKYVGVPMAQEAVMSMLGGKVLGKLAESASMSRYGKSAQKALDAARKDAVDHDTIGKRLYNMLFRQDPQEASRTVGAGFVQSMKDEERIAQALEQVRKAAGTIKQDSYLGSVVGQGAGGAVPMATKSQGNK